ncbi:MAG: 34-kDa subunit of RNA polymerase III (C) [Cirrosporium novae-zelandiae]|nr:MAG: 34-kDa subunit of RNA polymerase III (C) [Cirrosporium novae-zelandiae]
MATTSTSDEAKDLKILQDELYARCNQEPPDHLFDQKELLSFDIIPSGDLMILVKVINALVNHDLFRVFKKDGQALWKLVKKEDAAKLRVLTRDEKLVYQQVEGSGHEGIWTKTVKDKTSLHQSVVTKCIRSLESKGHIKRIRSVKSPNKIIYILSSIQASEDVTGGAWYTDGVLDIEFINRLMDAIEKYIEERSWMPVKSKKRKVDDMRAVHFQSRNIPPPPVAVNPKYTTRTTGWAPYPPSYNGYPTCLEITRGINKMAIAHVKMSEKEVATLIQTLIYDGRVVKVNATNDIESKNVRYKTAHKPSLIAGDGLPHNAMTEAPCAACPKRDVCGDDGPVNPRNCEYFQEWLKLEF